MSDKIADKDIKNDVGFRIKKMMEIDVDIDNCKNFQCKAIDKIFDLEKDLKAYKMSSKVYKEDSNNYRQEVQRQSGRIVELGNDLETWKKIAEKLAERLGKICIDTKPLVIGTIADEVHGCDKYISCKECFLDWARNEVLKNE